MPRNECNRDAFRWMRRKTRRDKVRNENIFIKIGVASTKKKRENHSWWFVHVRCTLTYASIRRIEFINLGQVIRAKERPKKIWMKVIREDINVIIKTYCSIGMSWESWSIYPARHNSLLIHVAYSKHVE